MTPIPSPEPKPHGSQPVPTDGTMDSAKDLDLPSLPRKSAANVVDVDSFVRDCRKAQCTQVGRVAIAQSSSLTPVPSAHLPEYITIAALPRHNKASSALGYSDIASPMTSLPTTAHNSRAPSPALDELAISHPTLNSQKWRLTGGYFACFLIGWADGVTGTVMPYLNAEFHLTTMTTSLLWAGTTCGFFIGTFLIEIILSWLGRFSLGRSEKDSAVPCTSPIFSKTTSSFGHSATQARHLALLIASSMHACYFIMMGSRGGFPVMFVAYAMAAFARALLTGLLNAYFASGPKQALGFAYGIASFGSVASPLVCQFTIAAGIPWFHFYYGSLVLSGLNILLLAIAYKPSLIELAQEHNDALHQARERLGTKGDVTDGSFNLSSSGKSPTSSVLRLEMEKGRKNTLKLVLCMPYQWALSAFALLYCGSETTTQGFMVTYLLGTKHAHPKTVGYVTSGFWAGISLGRFAWGYLNEYLSFAQRKHVVHISILIATILQVLVWVTKSHVQNATATGFIGLFYGPVFPAALAMANDVLPEEVHMVSMALINAFASLGGALFPFITGAILSLKGVAAFTFVTVPLAASLAILWGLFPSRLQTRNSAVV